MKFIPLVVIAFILTGAFLSSCESDLPNKPCDTCDNPCDTCIPCDTCDTTLPCDTCDTTDPVPNPNDTTSHDFTWTEYTIPGEVYITGCAVFDTAIYAMGTYLYRFTGSGWEKLPVVQAGTGRSLSFADYTLFGLAPNNIWIVKSDVVDHYNGDESAWGHSADEFRLVQLGVLSVGEDGGLIACWGTSANDMFFVGHQGTILHFDGTNWTKFPKVTTKDLRSVWGTSHNDVWASGFNSSEAETVLLHYDGVSWKEDPLSLEKGLYATGGFSGVWACDSAGKKFVTTSGAILIRKTENRNWRSDSGYIPNRLNDGTFIGISPFGNSPNDMFTIGGWGFVAHWNGKTWKKYEELYNYGNPNYGPGAFSCRGNTACVGGTKSGQSWIAIGRRK